MHPFTLFLILYVGSALVAVGLLWLRSDKLDHNSFEATRRQKVFHCVRCGNIYGARQKDVSEGIPCPNCEYRNFELSY